jgi:hypothetical protein
LLIFSFCYQYNEIWTCSSKLSCFIADLLLFMFKQKSCETLYVHVFIFLISLIWISCANCMTYDGTFLVRIYCSSLYKADHCATVYNTLQQLTLLTCNVNICMIDDVTWSNAEYMRSYIVIPHGIIDWHRLCFSSITAIIMEIFDTYLQLVSVLELESTLFGFFCGGTNFLVGGCVLITWHFVDFSSVNFSVLV